MKVEISQSLPGEWLKIRDLSSGTQLKIVEEARQEQSNFDNKKTRWVTQVKVQGEEGVKNININFTSLKALVSAFGDDSSDWVGKVVTARVEQAIVGGKKVHILYLVPEGYDLVEGEDGFMNISSKKQTDTKPGETEGSDDPEDIDPKSIDF